jgi:acyl-CoA thioesterase-1
LTAGKGLDVDQAYPALVEELARAKGLDWRVINAGVSGDTSAAGLRRIDWVLKAKPTVVFLALGANDGLRGQSTEDLSKNLTTIIEKCRATGAMVVMSGLQIPTNYGETYRETFAAVFPAVAEKHKVPLMPFLLEGVGGVPTLNQADGIHPTADGQQIMAKLVFKFLQTTIVK